MGNYEYYYACGKLKGLMDLAVDEKTAPLVMKEIVDEASASYTPDEETEPVKAYLKTLLLRYRPADEHMPRWQTYFAGAGWPLDVPTQGASLWHLFLKSKIFNLNIFYQWCFTSIYFSSLMHPIL